MAAIVRTLLSLSSVPVLFYLVLFLNNWQPSRSLPSIDYKPEAISSLLLVSSSPAINNLILILLFTLPHSFITVASVKRFLISYLLCSQKRNYLAAYTFWASISLLVLYLFWSPVTIEFWNIGSGWPAKFVQAIQIFFWTMFVHSLLSTEITGNTGIVLFIKTILGLAKKQEKPKDKPKEKILVISGTYGVVRHPLMACTIAGLWLTPTMTVGHLLLSGSFTVYILIAVRFSEEPKLISEYGPAYLDYQKKVPYQLIPGIY